MKLIFATNNQHKVDEIQYIIGNKFEVVSLKQAGIDIDIPEPHDTLEENAIEKSSTIFKLTNTDCFSEDTGLEVEGLNGEPGVKSARYAGDGKDFDKNIEKLLLKLGEEKNRRARFRTVISLIINKEQHLFEGVCEGQIIYSPRGTNGFGYDSVFIPTGADRTFAEMTMGEKNAFSHRKKATEKLVLFLNKLHIT
jgi:XTP/dITP diphosphohydrolase